jgi:hypothetical protein
VDSAQTQRTLCSRQHKTDCFGESARILAAHLDDKRNFAQEVTTIVASLLEASLSDAAMVHRILEFVTTRTDVGLKNTALGN